MNSAPDRSRRVLSVLAIGGLDPSGAAGLAADQRAIQAQGVHALLVATANTAQGLRAATAVTPLPARAIAQQIESLEAEFRFGAIKLGMLASHAGVREVLRLLDRHPRLPVICDPVFETTSGMRLIDDRGYALMRRELLPRVSLLTPNLPELFTLAGSGTIGEAISVLLADGTAAILVKGGHGRAGSDIHDILIAHAPRRTKTFTHRRKPIDARGTGCALASAIAARLALGDSLLAAVTHGERYLQAQLDAAFRPSRSGKAVLPGLMRIRAAK